MWIYDIIHPKDDADQAGIGNNTGTLWNYFVSFGCMSTSSHAAAVWQILILENVRFHPEETKNEPGFAKEVSHSDDSSHKIRHALLTYAA